MKHIRSVVKQGLCVNHNVSLNLFPVSVVSVVSVVSLCYVFFFRSKKCSSQVCFLILLCLENIIIINLFSISASVFSVVPVVFLFFCCLCAMCSFSGQRSAVVKVRLLNLLCFIIGSLLSFSIISLLLI